MVPSIVSGSERGGQWPFNESDHKERASLFKQLLKNDAFSPGIDQGAGIDILYEYTLFLCLSLLSSQPSLFVYNMTKKKRTILIIFHKICRHRELFTAFIQHFDSQKYAFHGN